MKIPVVLTFSLLAPLGLAIPATAENPAQLQQLLETQNCQGCDLRDANLEGVSLRGADLTNANLSGANLRNADLRYANFRGANLAEAVAIAADLQAANFTNANLRELDIRGANLKDAVLTGANTCGWRRQDADLTGVNLAEAGCRQPTPTPTPQPTPAPTPTPVAVLSEDDASALIYRWLDAKDRIFAAPFDRQLLRELTTGILYADSLNAVNWLQDNNAFYEYGVQRVESVSRFVAEGNKATVEARVTENRTLYENGRVNPEQTSFATNLIRYNLEWVNGRWKIADYKIIN